MFIGAPRRSNAGALLTNSQPDREGAPWLLPILLIRYRRRDGAAHERREERSRDRE